MPGLTVAQRRFIDELRSYIPAVEAGGVPGAVMIAQAVLESGWGRSGLARLGNALFGVKARSGWAGRVYSGTTAEFVPGRGYVK
ncbi:MAG: glucosaminidase domain-containing protein, partial [bacterium]